MPLSTLNNSAILDQLQCLICLELLCQPLELLCRALVCTTCMVKWFEVFSCSNVKCPCCFVDAPSLPSALKPAPPIIMVLLQDIHVECSSCKKNIRIGDFTTSGKMCINFAQPYGFCLYCLYFITVTPNWKQFECST